MAPITGVQQRKDTDFLRRQDGKVRRESCPLREQLECMELWPRIDNEGQRLKIRPVWMTMGGHQL